MQSVRILVTGGAGFIGSHLIHLLTRKYTNVKIFNLDSLTYASDLSRLKEIESLPNYEFIKGDIRDESLVDSIFQEHEIDGVMHLAAESHVDNSIANPKIFFETNIMGTQNLLNAAKKLWLGNKRYKHARFLHVSTDEVYGALGDSGYFTEESPYAPTSPYSASKASSDFMVRSYFHTYDLPVIISNCSNNFGSMQHDEKLIPTIIRNALAFKQIPIYGNGANIRDWLFAKDHCTALERIFQEGKIGDSYNIGASNEQTNLGIAKMICKLLDEIKPNASSYSDLISFVEDRAGHDYRYAIDSSKIWKDLGWKSENSFVESLRETVTWYVGHYAK